MNDIQSLRAENARLKARIEELEADIQLMNGAPDISEDARALMSMYGLTLKQGLILHKLLISRQEIVTRNDLLLSVWGYNDDVVDRIVDTKIKFIRKRVGRSGIETIYGVGYRLTPELRAKINADLASLKQGVAA